MNFYDVVRSLDVMGSYRMFLNGILCVVAWGCVFATWERKEEIRKIRNFMAFFSMKNEKKNFHCC